jgi:hypothetical protein
MKSSLLLFLATAALAYSQGLSSPSSAGLPNASATQSTHTSIGGVTSAPHAATTSKTLHSTGASYSGTTKATSTSTGGAEHIAAGNDLVMYVAGLVAAGGVALGMM